MAGLLGKLRLAFSGAQLATGFTKVFSIKVFAGFAAGVFLIMGGMLWKAAHDRDIAQGQVQSIADVVAEEKGVEQLFPNQIIPAIKEIIVRGKVAAEEAKTFKRAVSDQNAQVRRLAADSDAARAASSRQVAQVKILVQQRDRWITEAHINSLRTEERACPTELGYVKDVLDELYEAGF